MQAVSAAFASLNSQREPSSHRRDKLSHPTRATSGGQSKLVNMPRADRRSEGWLLSCDKKLGLTTNDETFGRTWRNLGNAPRSWKQSPTFLGARVD
jgi:hypothetical protein